MDPGRSKKEPEDDMVLEPKSLESRMYLNQQQSYAKHKKAKMSYTPSSDSLSLSHLARTISGGKPSTSTSTLGKGFGESTSKRLSTSHGERFCSPRYAVPAPTSAEEAYMRELKESWEAEPSAAKSSRSLVISPLRRPESASTRKQTPGYHEDWKRKRGKFALAEKQKPFDYQWMPFLELLKRQPTTTEFIYLQPPRIPKTPEFDPFELEVVTYGQIDSPYYYTVSSQGVTLFRDGDAEFTPLDQWERGYRSYKCIINLNVFRQYKYWKSWKVWKHHVRRKKKKISVELLLKLLFTCNVIFAAVLLQIRAMCVGLWTVRFLQLDMGEVYRLERFMTIQESRREENSKILLELTNEAVEALRESCIRALSKLEEDLLGRRKDEPQDELMKGVTEKEDGKETSNRNKLAGVAARWKAQKERDSEEKESQERYTYLIAAAKRSEQVRLQNCVRLTDYLISDALREVLLSTFRDLLHRVAHRPQPPPAPEARQSEMPAPAAEGLKTPKPVDKETEAEKEKVKEREEEKKRASKRGSSSRRSTMGKRESALLMKSDEEKKLDRLQVFEVDLAMIDDHLVLVPSFSEFEKNIEIWIKGMMDVVRSLRRLLYHPQLDGVVDKGDSGTENLATYLDLIGEAQFGGLIASIKVSISLAYKDADKNKGTFKPYVDTAIKSKFISQQSMRDEIKAGIRDLEVFKNDILRYRTEIKEIEAAPNSADIGILHINYVTLKDTLLPFPREALQNIYQLLPKLANEHYEVFINEIHMSEKKMAVKPTTVEEFVDIANFAEAFHSKLDKLEAEFDLIHDHYALMRDHNIPIPDLEYASYLMMNNDFQSCKEAMEIVEETKNENIRRFSSDLAVEVDKLRQDVITIREAAQNPMTLNPDIDQEVVLEYMSKLNEDVITQKAKTQRIVMYQKLFQVDESRFDDLLQAAEEVDLRYSLWLGLKELAEKSGAWIATHFESLDTQEVEEVVNKYAKLTVKLERGIVPNPVVQRLRKQVDDLRLAVPVMQNMRNKCLRDRHWKKIELEINHKIERNAQFTLGKLIEYNVMEYKAQIANISNEATQEAALEELMEGVKQKWSTIEFAVKQYKEFKDLYVLGGVDEVLAALEDSMVTMNTVTSSRFVSGIKSEVDKMETQLKHFGKTLDQWCECQKQWMYLESIFSAPDIQRQLPNESKAFFAVDKQFKDIMKRTHDRANALQAGTSPGWLETFEKSNETLEKIQKNLEDYLETKRMAFPRFYFLSNDELLEILAQTRNVQAVQPHMQKCFDGIRSLDFGEDPKSVDIYAMISGEGERIGLGKNLKARGNVENWLTAVEQNMVASLRRLAKAAVQDYGKRPRPQWTLLHAAQLVVMTSQIYWSKMVEDALKAEGGSSVESLLQEALTLCINQLEALSVLVRGELKSLERKILCALITIDVHARDIVDDMIREKIFKATEFGWQMQLRYYWDDELEDSTIRQTNARFVYAYEYLGAQPRLVITPLTDRCYMTLTGALHLKLGGAPAGPAGTGKTETTKDLGKALGIQCVVFNCGENLDFKFMGKFLAGLAQCGAWACFDEFNRIDIEVLSVIAQQLLTIQNALKARLQRFNFEGREIKLLATCGVFITMNPGYAGRTELPDNLKVLFRPVSMMIPDYALVAEVMLFSEGFANAKVLSRKMVKLYKLASEQLSQQDHYDFGMRAVKSVLVMAGALKRANPDLVEDVVLIRAFKDSNLPKFLAQDVTLFLAIITDLFPGVEIPPQDFGELKLAIEECILAGGLQIVDAFVIKVIQLFETMNVRFGVMAVGPTGGGKTTCYRLLRDAMTKLRARNHPNVAFQGTHAYVLNPKCIKMGELYGEYDLLTNEWTDGLGSTIIRAAVADTTPDKKWIVFDGPVDAIWIENMNTVLDDNCILCLPNGERIKLNPVTMRMLFEVQDLAVASPATVSRCGMVYVPPEELGWHPYVKSWLQRFPKEIGIVLSPQCRDYIHGLFNEWMDTGLKFLRKNLVETIPSVNINIVTTLCWYYQGLLQPSRGINIGGEFTDQITGTLSRVFAFAYVWSVGGNIRHTSIEKFDNFIRKECETLAAYPSGETCFEYFVNVKEQSLSPWEEVIPGFTYNPSVSFFSLMVPTLDTVRLGWLFELNIEIQRSVLFAGVSGGGKSAIVLDMVAKLTETKNMMAIILNFSAQTTSIATQEAIESKLEKKGKNRYGGPFGKKIICFVDDVNMPMRERYFAQPPIELLRQFQDFRGFYDRVHLFWKDIADMTIAAACGPPGGGRNEVTPRFYRHFSMVSVQPPTEMTLRTIFGAILSGFLALFPPECKPYTKPIVDCSIEVFMRMSQELLPTPQKSHYTFNLRDVSKIFQGILMVKPVNCATKKQLRSLWIHECMRVFHDRLISAEDKLYFTTTVHELLKRSMETIETHKEIFEDQIIMYADFLRPGYAAEDRRYEQVTDFSKLPQLFKDYLEDCNMSTPKIMRLVFFKDAIAHTARISRVLRQPRGNAMLVGVGGSGKQSLTRFACFLSEYECFQIELTKGYSNFEFREDLKKIYKVAGIDGKPITFLFTDTQIVNEGFVEDINNLLNSGEVPGLFTPDEKDRLCSDIREYALTLGIPLTKDSLYNCFINRAREYIHVVLCMSPVGDPFRSRCRQFPSLINCCTIDWFDEWPEEALLTVSNHFLTAVNLGSDQVKKKVASMCVSIHTSVSDMATKFFNELRRKYYITPKSYLDCVNLYVELLNEKRKESLAAEDRFVNGLNKLKETNELIATMKIELGQLQPILAEKSEVTNKLLNEVSKETAAAQKVKETVVVEEQQVKEQAAATQLIKDDAQKELDVAMPALNAAVEALNSLNKSDITEMKSFVKPPSLVLLTMEAVCILLAEPVGWDSAKKIMADVAFIKRLMEYNKDGITPQIQKKLQKYINDPQFVPEAVQKQSNAATSMCMWVRAMNVYADVAKVVAPKKAALSQAEAALKLAADTLAGKQKQLAEVEAQVAKLKANLDVVQSDMDKLKAQALLTENRLIRAGKLTSALGDEAVRWRETAIEIAEKRKLLVGDVFLCAVCISYYGAFSGPYRADLVASWIQRFKDEDIPVSDDCSLRGILATPVEVREWNIWGLPSDDVSVDNGVLVTRGRRWPLMIDPQGQANSWIKAMEAKNGLRVVRLSDTNLLRTLESSIRIGNPVLLEDIGDTLDPALEPILQKQVFEKKGRWLIRLGDTDVDYDPHFKLYMTTKLANPHYLPEVCIKVTLVNFTVTMIGLEDQLLGDVVRKERADLEEQNDRLVVSISSDKKQLKDLEDKILRLLKESEGNILDDEVLINTLNNSKLTSGVIQGRVKQAEITEKEIKAAREEYRVVAKRGSILYFIISDLALIDTMYQYSLTYFAQLFNQCIDTSPRSEVLEDRLQILIRYMTEFLYMSVSRGLFEEHKLTFSFLICTAIMKHMGEIDQEDWLFFLIGGADELPEGALPNPDNVLIPDRVWVSICQLEITLPKTFKKLTRDITTDWAQWVQYFKTPEPHTFKLPGTGQNHLTPFQRLLVLKVMRGEKLVFGVTLFVISHLGQKFVGSVPLQLEEIFKDTSCINPVIFILTTGADPSGILQRFAEKMDRKAGDRLHMISLGQGQGPVAETLIQKSRKSGDWVCLQNCHLASSWMIPMERIVEKFLPERADIHPDFRLWLTSFPSKDFPVPVLQNGIKLTNEPPKGVRANMLSSYTVITEDFLESCTKKATWKKLVFGIAFFHAVIQERRKFGPLGWNIKYDFNSSDLECALQTLLMFLEEQPDIPWPALLYVTGEINYGGRVTDDLDRRCLMSTLKNYYSLAALQDTYAFTSTGIYKSPPEGAHSSYVEYIKSFPTAEGPDLFGMHENANLTFQRQESNKILNVVASIQPKASTGGAGKNIGETILELAAKLLEGLPPPLKSEEAVDHIPEFGPTGQVNSLLVVLQQESERFNRLVRVMRSTLVEIQRAIKGLVVMSADLEAMFNNFTANKVPELWTAVAYPSLKPLSTWILDHHRRMEFMRNWIHEGNPLCFWLPGFFFPQNFIFSRKDVVSVVDITSFSHFTDSSALQIDGGFMTGALQTHARKYQIPIDTLTFGFNVLEYEDAADVKDAPADGLLISGLYLDGARWDRKHKCLVEALPGEIYSRLPVVHFIPIVNYKPPANEYQCPLYKTHVRAGVLTTTGASSNYILNVSLAIDPDTTPDFWVLQGIALLCQTPY